MPSEPGDARRIQLEIARADLLSFDGDALVVPTLSEGTMVEGVAARVKKAGGKEVEDEARQRAPIPVGAAVATGAGNLLVHHVVHVMLSLCIDVFDGRWQAGASLTARHRVVSATERVP